MVSVKRDYKSSVFCMLWEQKEDLLSLYNAVNNTNYTNPDDLVINTLKNAIYMSMKNDLSFIFDMSLNLYEHQSTVNPNMPLRDLLYVAHVLQGMIKDEDLYKSTLVKVPTPRFVVFYNGKQEQPARQVFRLSDAFIRRDEEPNLELMVTVLNINPGYNTELMQKCKKLQQYMQYIGKVREYVADMSIEQAVEKAVNECIEEGILSEFLLQNKAEAIEMSIFEYNEEAHMENVRQEGYDQGIEKGKIEGVLVGKIESILEILEELSEVPEELQQEIRKEKNMEVLKRWNKLAAKSATIEQFTEMMWQ